MANLDARGMVARIYVGDHLSLLHTKYLNSGPYGFNEEIFEVFFFIISLWELMSPVGMANLDPRGIAGRIYEGDHLMLLNTKYLSSGPNGFREEDFLFFPCKSMRTNEPRGVSNLDPRGMVGRIYVGDHLTLLHTKYLSSGPHGFRETFFMFLQL